MLPSARIPLSQRTLLRSVHHTLKNNSCATIRPFDRVHLRNASSHKPSSPTPSKIKVNFKGGEQRKSSEQDSAEESGKTDQPMSLWQRRLEMFRNSQRDSNFFVTSEHRDATKRGAIFFITLLFVLGGFYLFRRERAEFDRLYKHFPAHFIIMYDDAFYARSYFGETAVFLNVDARKLSNAHPTIMEL